MQVNPNAIFVNKRQEGNPVLKHIRNVRWQFADIVPDYQMGQNACAVFLSLRCGAQAACHVSQHCRLVACTLSIMFCPCSLAMSSLHAHDDTVTISQEHILCPGPTVRERLGVCTCVRACKCIYAFLCECVHFCVHLFGCMCMCILLART